MIQENTSTSRSTHTYAMVTTAFMAAVTCILAPLSIPIGPVPISPIHPVIPITSGILPS